MNKHYPIIVIGAGVAGVAAAHELKKQHQDFVIISREIGGRILASTDGNVNYSACIIGGDNTNIIKRLKLTRRIKLEQVIFHGDGPAGWSSAWQQLVPLGKIYYYALWFRRKYHIWQKHSVNIGQRQAMIRDRELYALYQISAAEWLGKKNIGSFAQEYLAPIVRMCTFSELTDISAFDFLHIAMYLTVPVYEFVYDQTKFFEGLEPLIIKDRVTRIESAEPFHIITASGQSYTAERVILAVPPEVAQELTPFNYDKLPKKATMYHLRGQIKSIYTGGHLHIFRSPENEVFIWPQVDGSYLCYRLKANEDFGNLFDGAVEIIAKHSWDPAFWMGGTSLLDVTLKSGLFLAGDYNVVGVEDAYLSGIAAANACLAALRR